jgi:hypothetical protein
MGVVMGKRFFYEFKGRVFLEADNKAEAEKLVTGISLADFLIDEELYGIDENYVPHDKKKRERQYGTHLHHFNDQDEYQEFKMRECRYGNIFKEFLHGKFDKNELMKRMAKADKKKLDDYAVVDQINMIDLESKKLKTVKHCFVD